MGVRSLVPSSLLVKRKYNPNPMQRQKKKIKRANIAPDVSLDGTQSNKNNNQSQKKDVNTVTQHSKDAEFAEFMKEINQFM